MRASLLIKSEMQRIVYAPVYTPYRVDTDHEAMTPDEVCKMAYAFLANGYCDQIHTNHDGVPNGCRVIESFIARKGDSDFIEGEWVLGVQIVGDDLWQRVLKGELNGFSWGASDFPDRIPMIVDLLHPISGEGTTEKNDIGGINHTHEVFVKFDSDARMLPSYTGLAEGHAHLIIMATATEMAEDHGHRLQFEFVGDR